MLLLCPLAAISSKRLCYSYNYCLSAPIPQVAQALVYTDPRETIVTIHSVSLYAITLLLYLHYRRKEPLVLPSPYNDFVIRLVPRLIISAGEICSIL